MFGESATFTATALGAPPLSHQWFKDNTNAVACTNATLALTNLCRTNSGVYSVRVTNSGGATWSSNAVLTVRVPARLLTPRYWPDGTMGFLAMSADGNILAPAPPARFEVQASTDLVHWETLSNAIISGDFTAIVHDASSTNFPARFYRMVEH